MTCDVGQLNGSSINAFVITFQCVRFDMPAKVLS